MPAPTIKGSSTANSNKILIAMRSSGKRAARGRVRDDAVSSSASAPVSLDVMIWPRLAAAIVRSRSARCSCSGVICTVGSTSADSDVMRIGRSASSSGMKAANSPACGAAAAPAPAPGSSSVSSSASVLMPKPRSRRSIRRSSNSSNERSGLRRTTAAAESSSPSSTSATCRSHSS